MTRIAIFGAGAIGCWVGGRLAAAGSDVALIGRPRVMGELAHGVELTELGGKSWRATPALATDAKAAAGADIVIVTVKSTATAQAGAELAPVIGANSTVISLQNGVRNPPTLRAALPRTTVLAAMIGYNVAHVGPAHYHRNTTGEIFVQADPSVEPLVIECRRAELALAAREDILAVQWGKLVLNLNNAINALSGLPLVDELANREFRLCMAAALREALDVLAAANQPVAKILKLSAPWAARLLPMPNWLFGLIARRVAASDPGARSSMADDFAAGRLTEVDYLQGEIVALAKTLDRDAPVNRTLVELVHAAETGGKRDFTGAELYAAIAKH